MTNQRINNLPQYAERYEHLVVREVDGELWFYGAWNDYTKAHEVAHTVRGRVISNR